MHPTEHEHVHLQLQLQFRTMKTGKYTSDKALLQVKARDQASEWGAMNRASQCYDTLPAKQGGCLYCIGTMRHWILTLGSSEPGEVLVGTGMALD